MHLPPFKLERFFAKYEFTTEFLLCASDCETVTVAELLALDDDPAGVTEQLHASRLGYTESAGSLSLRAEICNLYQTIQPEDVLVHSGAQEAIFLFMLTAFREGDHVIVHAPAYQSLAEVARSAGCEVSLWQAEEASGWSLDHAELRRLMRANTRAVIVNTPHNPTGYLMSREGYDALHRFVQEHDLLLFSDEVYRESEYDPAARLPAGCDYGEHAVSLGVTSKTYGLAGLRIGWVATKNRKLLDKMASLKDYTTICNSAPGEFLAEIGLRNRQRLIDRNLGIILHNLRVIDDFFGRHPDLFTWVRPQAGSMAFPRYHGGNVESFCDQLVRTAGVLLLPGTVYDDSQDHFRLGLGRRNLPAAVERLEDHLSR